MTYLTVHPDGVRMELDADETILAGLFRHGYAYKVGCRRGGCGVCKVDLLSGEVRYTRPVASTVLTDEERSDGTCLSCRAVPVTDVEIALREQSLRVWNPLAHLFPTSSSPLGPRGLTPTAPGN